MPTGEERYALIAGRRRYEAAKALGWEFLSVKVLPASFSTRQLFQMFLAENLHRLHLRPKAVKQGADVDGATLELLSLEDRRGSEPQPMPQVGSAPAVEKDWPEEMG